MNNNRISEKSMLFLLTVILLFATSSCMPLYKGSYKVGLMEVEKPSDATNRFGESTIANFEEDGTLKYRFEDDIIDIVWIPLKDRFSFAMKNKTDHSIKIIWDEVVYVDETGSSQRVMHAGVKYSDRNNPQPPTVIVKNANFEDSVIPTDHVYYISGQYGGWQITPLFTSRANSNEELIQVSQNYVGKIIMIHFPLQIKETVNEYLFKFKVEDFTPNQ